MLHARRHRGFEAVTAIAVLALLVLAAASEFTLFTPTDGTTGGGGAGGAYPRFESTPVGEAVRGVAGGSTWVTPVAAALAGLGVLVVGTWILLQVSRRATRTTVVATVDATERTHPSAAQTGTEEHDDVVNAWRAVEALTTDGRGVLAQGRTTTSTARAAVERGAPAEVVFELARLYDRHRYSTHPVDGHAQARAKTLASVLCPTRDVT